MQKQSENTDRYISGLMAHIAAKPILAEKDRWTWNMLDQMLDVADEMTPAAVDDFFGEIDDKIARRASMVVAH